MLTFLLCVLALSLGSSVVFIVLSVTAKDDPAPYRPKQDTHRDPLDELWREPDGDDAADCVDDDEQRSTADLQSQVAFLEDMLADLAPDHHLERVSLESRSKWLRSILTKRQPVQADRELVELPIDVTETEPRGDA